MTDTAAPDSTEEPEPGSVMAAALAYRQRAAMLGLPHVGADAMKAHAPTARVIPEGAVADAAAAHRRRMQTLGLDDDGEDSARR